MLTIKTWFGRVGFVCAVVLSSAAMACGDDSGDEGQKDEPSIAAEPDAGAAPDDGRQGDGGGTTGRSDAGRDAGPESDGDAGGGADAGRDAGSDGGGPDAQSDGVDAGPDAGPDAETGPEVVRLEHGEPCDPAADLCGQGLSCHAASGVCCAPGQDCCTAASDCPARYSDERGCFERDSCWGSVETPNCIDHVCGSTFIPSDDDPSGCEFFLCTGATCEDGVFMRAWTCNAEGECGGSPPARCAGNFACFGGQCGISCQDGTSEGCPSGFVCEGGIACVELSNPGADCSSAAGGEAVCTGDAVCNPDNERCCAPGEVCCDQPADCPDEAGGETYRGLACTDPASCAGELRAATCEDHVCGFSASADGGACEALTCDGGVCESGVCVARRIGEPCVDNGQCLSGDCEVLEPGNGACRGAPGEPCDYPNGHCSGNVCWYADAQDKTFRCAPPDCHDFCSFIGGDETLPTCDGTRQQMAAAALGNPLAVCYDDGGGTALHEAVCDNSFDDDADGLTDAADPDCQAGSGDFFHDFVGRGVRAMCQADACGSADGGGTSQCASGAGGCFDAACHLHQCWPNAGECAGRTRAEAECKWWDSAFDLDDSCDAGELFDRPDGSHCGFGCTCQGGVASEFLCGDGRDNDFDGAVDAADPDCMRQHGDPCIMIRFNGAPDAGNADALFSGANGNTDQCEGAGVCWCADADCDSGVCLGAQADCVANGSFLCNSYPTPDATNCGTPTARTAGDELLPGAAVLGTCSAGVFIPMGAKQAGEACSSWSECASGYCECGDAACASRVCWDLTDCGGHFCAYRVDGSTCAPLDVGSEPVYCGGGAIGPLDTTGKCGCAEGGIMVELDCDDGITNDWPQTLSTGIRDTAPDWQDVDCYFNFLGGPTTAWQESIEARYSR